MLWRGSWQIQGSRSTSLRAGFSTASAATDSGRDDVLCVLVELDWSMQAAYAALPIPCFHDCDIVDDIPVGDFATADNASDRTIASYL